MMKGREHIPDEKGRGVTRQIHTVRRATDRQSEEAVLTCILLPKHAGFDNSFRLWNST